MVQMNQFARQKQRHICREKLYGHQSWKAELGGNGDGMNWVIGIDIYTLIYLKQITTKKIAPVINIFPRGDEKLKKFKSM